MGALINSSGVLMCSHGGRIQIPSSDTSFTVDGGGLIRESDLMSGFESGCPLRYPCVAIAAIVSGQSNMMSSNGQRYLKSDLVALTNAGSVVVASPGQSNVFEN